MADSAHVGETLAALKPIRTPLTEGMITEREKEILLRALRLDISTIAHSINRSDNGSQIQLLKLAQKGAIDLLGKVGGW